MLKGRRVLLVEDEALVLMCLQDMVAELGCEIAGSATALQPAIHLARDLQLDVAVIDVNLNGVLVTPVAETLAARSVPFIFTTGYDAHINSSLADRPRLIKPYMFHDLRAALLRIVGDQSC
jgi:DNA-binding NarL/FixJ family response regulator